MNVPIQCEISFEDNVDFNFKAQHIGLYVEQWMKKKIGNIRKINFVFNDNEVVPRVNGKDLKICNIYLSYGFSFFNGPQVLAKIAEVLKYLIQSYYPNVVIEFDEMLEDAIRKKFNFPLPYIKRLYSSNRHFYAQVDSVLTEDYFDFIVRIFDRKNYSIIVEKSIIKAHPNIFLCRRLITKSQWKGESAFVVTDELGEIEFSVDLMGAFNIHFNPSVNSHTELKGYLKALYYLTSHEDRLKLLSV